MSTVEDLKSLLQNEDEKEHFIYHQNSDAEDESETEDSKVVVNVTKKKDSHFDVNMLFQEYIRVRNNYQKYQLKMQERINNLFHDRDIEEIKNRNMKLDFANKEILLAEEKDKTTNLTKTLQIQKDKNFYLKLFLALACGIIFMDWYVIFFSC